MEFTSGHETNELREAEANLLHYTLNYITSMSLKCAVQLCIPDLISSHDKPVTLLELAKALPVDQMKCDQLYRLMRILVHMGFFALSKPLEGHGEVGYILTPSSKLLLKNHTTSLSPLLIMLTDPITVTPFHFMDSIFQGNVSTATEAAYGMTLYDYCGKHPQFNTSFNNAMDCHSKFLMSVVLRDYRIIFEGSSSLVDVGGGTGTVSKAILEAFPSMKCVVLDLPHVISNMERSQNLQFVAGDMFKFIPSADIALLKWICHNWDDEECVNILKQCKEAIPTKDAGGKVIIFDMVVDTAQEKFESTESQLCFDILMMATHNGKERTETEWRKLLREAGFTRHKITPALGLMSIIEAFP